MEDSLPFIPPRARSTGGLARAAGECRGCPLWHDACQVVFGEGSDRAELMLVGEQPGDREDREGKPFVGPAGRELDGILDRLGIERSSIYVTNAVKHFKFRRSGKRRIHDKPNRNEVKACRPWLDAELRVVAPKAVVALGATAAREMFGPAFRVTRQHGQQVADGPAPISVGTIHPSAILRARGADRDEMRQLLADDLGAVISRLGELAD
jgi:DNA polymerase